MPATFSTSSPGGGSSFDAVIFGFAASRAPATLVHGSSASQRPSTSPSGHGSVVEVDVDDVLVELVVVEVLVGSSVVDVVDDVDDVLDVDVDVEELEVLV